MGVILSYWWLLGLSLYLAVGLSLWVLLFATDQTPLCLWDLGGAVLVALLWLPALGLLEAQVWADRSRGTSARKSSR